MMMVCEPLNSGAGRARCCEKLAVESCRVGDSGECEYAPAAQGIDRMGAILWIEYARDHVLRAINRRHCVESPKRILQRRPLVGSNLSRARNKNRVGHAQPLRSLAQQSARQDVIESKWPSGVDKDEFKIT